MNEYALYKLGHLLLFVYWLGGDLGTFYASRFVSRDDLSAESRGTALKIMAGCDQAPRICMTLIFPFGLQMAWMARMVQVPAWSVALVWLISIGWLAMVLLLHFQSGKPFTRKLTRFDFVFRLAVITACLGLAAYSLLTGDIVVIDWITVKIILFAALVAFGLLIRVHLRPFEPAFASLLTHGPDPETNRAISDSLARCRPYVYLIWVGLLFAAALSLRLVEL